MSRLLFLISFITLALVAGYPTNPRAYFTYDRADGTYGPNGWGFLSTVNFSSPTTGIPPFEVVSGPIATSCNGVRQSPINIDTSRVSCDSSLSSFYFLEPNATVNLKLTNLGKTAEVDVEIAEDVIVKGGFLNASKSYKVVQFHFHSVSEHAFNGLYGKVELHIVCVNEEDPLDYVVLGILYTEAKEGTSSPLSNLTGSLNQIDDWEEEWTIADINLNDLLPTNQIYYTYKGSLTTPPCSEVVTWVVFWPPQPLPGSQIQAFQRMYLNSPYLQPFGENSRPVQPLNNRKISVYPCVKSIASIVSISYSILVTLFFLFSYFFI